MPRSIFEWLALTVAISVVIVILAWNVVSWTDLERSPRARPPAVSRVLAAPAPQTPRRQSPQSPARPTAADVALTAARGDSWLSVREGSIRGRVLFEGVLSSGRTLRVRSKRLWIRFGAAANLDLRINGMRQPPLFGTFDAFVGPAGARPDRRVYATAAQSP